MTEGLLQRITKNSDTIGHVLNDEVIIKISMQICFDASCTSVHSAVPLPAGTIQQ